MKDFLQKAKISPLHTHTVYSVLDGASSIDEYVAHCVANGLPGLGVTDHGWAIGGLELYQKCKKAGITALPGVEFYVAPDKDYPFNGKPYDYYHITAWAVTEQGYRNLLKLASRSWEQDKILTWKRGKKDELENYKATQVPVLRTNDQVFVQVEIPRVVTKFGTQEKPRITFDELLEYNEGIVLGSGCLIGALSKPMLNGEMKGSHRNLGRILEVYKDRLFMEIMPHACSHNYDRETRRHEPNPPLSHHECVDFDPTGKRQVAVNNQIIKMARQYKLPLLLTVDSHFVKPNQKRLQDVLLSNSDGGWTFSESYHMPDLAEAAESWANNHGWDVEQQKIFQEAVENNDILVGMAKGLTISTPYRQPEPNYPQDLIEFAKDHPSEARKALLVRAIKKHGRMNWNDPAYVERLQKELDVICDNGIVDFSDYFIFLEDVYAWAAAHSIFSAPGRGSGAGSLLAYCLKITHLDPIKWRLPFERFLSMARLKRGKFPDIDCDFGSRDALIAYLRERFGDKMAQASTLGTLKLKSAIRDACRAILGMNGHDAIVEAVCKTIPNEPQGVNSKDFLLGYKDQDGNLHEGHLHENESLDQFFKAYPPVYEAVLQLLGIPRSVGRHASAFLISNAPISDSVPTCVISGYLCTQYQASASNNMVEKAGLIKFDFLGVNTLKDIENCIRLVQAKHGYKVWSEELILDGEKFKIQQGDLAIDQLPDRSGKLMNIYDLPEDQGVFADLSAGKTITVFQMTSALMTGQTRMIQPTALRHCSDIVALVRPGPLLADTGVLIPDHSRFHTGTGRKTYTMTELYIDAKAGVVTPTYAHEGMRAILEETYGCAAYQEQLQQMFVDLAGYSLEEADYLRETLAKKKRQDMEKAIPDLRRRLAEKGWSEQQAEIFVGLCVSSSAYSFNKAHSAAYAVVAYQCAYLKHHYPVEWWTAVLQNAKVEDIREKGYAQVLQSQQLLELPSINGPTDTFIPSEGMVKAPLYLIDRVGDTACAEIERARRAGGNFESFQDFFERVEARKVNEGVITNLILCETFRDIEILRSPQEILEEYYYLKKVSSLKLGEGKKGQDLREAVEVYRQKEIKAGKRLPVPDIFHDLLQNEIARAKALPIYRLNVHEDFQALLRRKAEITYNEDGKAFYRRGAGELIRVYKTVAEVRAERPYGLGCFIGLISSTSTFQYTDKRSGNKVTALKLQLQNDGESFEAVVWPTMYEEMGPPPEDKIVRAVGKIKESAREPGKFEMSVEGISFL